MAQQTGDEQTPNREELVQLGIQTAKSGNQQSARVIFQQVLSQDARNERALLWMAALTTDKMEKRRYLLKALKVNPKSTTARGELQRMAHNEKARTNRTLLLGGFVVVVVILMVVMAVAIIILMTSGG